MKKILFIISILAIVSCKNSEQKFKSRIDLSLNGNVKSIIETERTNTSKTERSIKNEYFFNKNGSKNRTVKYSFSNYIEYNYENDQIQNSIAYLNENNKPFLKSEFEYNKNRDLIKVRYLNDSLIRVRNFNYSKNDIGNKKVIEKEIYTNGKFREKLEKIYDQNNNEILRISYSKDDMVSEKIKLSYDSYGNNNLLEKYNNKGELIYKVVIKYDDQGHEIERQIINPNSKNETILNTYYEFDEKNNWTQKYLSRNGDTIKITERNIEYY